MGERQSGGGPAGRRRAHPAESVPTAVHHEGVPSARSGRGTVPVGLEALLAAALIRDGLDPGAEQRAVTAFLTARHSGTSGARTRRRDDWRVRRRRVGSHSLKATLSVLVAGVTLSGVAVAGIGAAGVSEDGPRDTGPTRTPSRTTVPATPGSTAPVPGPGSGSPDLDRPGTARDSGADCRALEQAEGRGRTPDPSALKRLTEAAGGAARVRAHCAGERGRDAGGPASAGPAGGAGNGPSGGAGGPAAPDVAGRGRESDQGGNPDRAPGAVTGESEGRGGTDGRGGSAGRPAEPGAAKP
ncbi:hypothetical protein HTV45_12390 [Streptomyces sp. CHD11]|uniref:hypothetical protein n=1 Tax=Streptomyces sp. CHD11 TaxID=2741325 RepID=UPI001BFC4DE5|nr:hypothetical protein [Streptomyces sp. CHD11]MBT3151674.1 hypothetical protein [Streptomyces sp. CHD11]